jgi:ATP-binding cassette subfamily B protein
VRSARARAPCRAVLGLAHQAEITGEVSWNGTPLVDRAAFLIPPNAAFLPQVPQLISDSVADNIALGTVDEEQLIRSLELAAVLDDIREMPDGTKTLIGPRGLRLSGGQRQRVATARALVHSPELVVLDDLSSALDIETELQLWSNLSAAGITVLAVSHRAVAFERADEVLRLEDGRLV